MSTYLYLIQAAVCFFKSNQSNAGSPCQSLLCSKRVLATVGDFNGVELKVYDRGRTICDCFKYRSKLDSEIFNKAINAYVADLKKNLANLSKYAKDMGVYTKLMNVMEVLLNG